VESYDIIGVYEVTPWYDSTWKQVYDIADVLIAATGASLFGAAGLVLGGLAGAYVAVVNGSTTTYWLCETVSQTASSTDWVYKSQYEAVTGTDWAIKYEVVE